jgi:hypothetical protein
MKGATLNIKGKGGKSRRIGIPDNCAKIQRIKATPARKIQCDLIFKSFTQFENIDI